jgi:uncharacterized membrane protein
MKKSTIGWIIVIVCAVLFAYPAFLHLPIGSAFLNILCYVGLELGIIIALIIGLSDPEPHAH